MLVLVQYSPAQHSTEKSNNPRRVNSRAYRMPLSSLPINGNSHPSRRRSRRRRRRRRKFFFQGPPHFTSLGFHPRTPIQPTVSPIPTIKQRTRGGGGGGRGVRNQCKVKKSPHHRRFTHQSINQSANQSEFAVWAIFRVVSLHFRRCSLRRAPPPFPST